MKIQGSAIRCRCASKERRAASHGEMNQNIVIPPSELSKVGDFPIRLADKRESRRWFGISSSLGNCCCQAASTGRGRRFYGLKSARLELFLKNTRHYRQVASAISQPALEEPLA
jgi:hypothetical protein